MTRYSDDALVNALFIQAECAGELQDAMYAYQWDPDLDPEEDEEALGLGDLVEDDHDALEAQAQAEIDAWHEAQDNREALPEYSLQEAEAEAMMARYDDDPSPYHGDYSEM